MGALNLQEWTMQEWTNTEEMAGVEIAGVDNDGGKTQQMDNDGVELSSRFTVADIADHWSSGTICILTNAPCVYVDTRACVYGTIHQCQR